MSTTVVVFAAGIKFQSFGLIDAFAIVQKPPAGTTSVLALPVKDCVSCGHTACPCPAADPPSGTSRDATSAAASAVRRFICVYLLFV